MAEPLTKDKLYCGCGLGDCTDGNLITVKDLKSALEEFEVEIAKAFNISYEYNLGLSKASIIMKKAFPAIYGDRK